LEPIRFVIFKENRDISNNEVLLELRLDVGLDEADTGGN